MYLQGLTAPIHSYFLIFQNTKPCLANISLCDDQSACEGATVHVCNMADNNNKKG